MDVQLIACTSRRNASVSWKKEVTGLEENIETKSDSSQIVATRCSATCGINLVTLTDTAKQMIK